MNVLCYITAFDFWDNYLKSIFLNIIILQTYFNQIIIKYVFII